MTVESSERWYTTKQQASLSRLRFVASRAAELGQGPSVRSGLNLLNLDAAIVAAQDDALSDLEACERISATGVDVSPLVATIEAELAVLTHVSCLVDDQILASVTETTPVSDSALYQHLRLIFTPLTVLPNT